MTLEQVLRWLSALIITGAAVMVTISVRRWAHLVVRPAMKYAAVILWITALYRLGLAATAFPSGTEWGRFIRLWVSIEFILLGLAFIGFANATWEFAKQRLTLGNGDK